jgi:23S rRNA (pseudouridine1915-N3)-methyltransferase
LKITLLSVGKPRDAPAIELHDRYAGRLPRLGVRYRSVWVPDVRPGGRYDDDEVRRREASALTTGIRKGHAVALDRRGRGLDSEQLATRIERWATPELTLVVGGPLGLHEDLLARCDERWSLSALTFPHEIVRGLVTEQLYRALTILRGVPYHKA